MENQGDRIYMGQMKFVCRTKVDIGDDVAVYNQKGPIIPEVFYIFDCPPGTQNLRLVTGSDRYGIILSGDKRFDLGCEMMGIYGNRFTTGLL